MNEAAIAAVMNRLPFVRWDRCVAIPGGDFDAYGWIERPDGRADFVLLTFPDGDPNFVGYTTSSGERSREIYLLLFADDDPAAECHHECERVEDAFGDLVENAIRLEARP